MKKTTIFLVITLMGATLLGCSDMSKQDKGVVTGAAAGGLIGSRFGSGGGQMAATAAGVLVGAFVGGQIGSYMDKTDRLEMSHALESTPTNHSRNWSNPDTDIAYKVTPTKTFYQKDPQGATQPCREYTTTAVIGGKDEQIYGTACRMDDGSWKIVGTHA